MNVETHGASPPASPLARLVTIEQYQQARAEFFPSVESVRWHMRSLRAQAESSGAVVFINGRLRIDPALYDELVLAAGRLAAAKRRGAAS